MLAKRIDFIHSVSMCNLSDNVLPVRKKIPHNTPSWVKTGEPFFITINCLNRNDEQLTNEFTAEIIRKSAVHCIESNKFWIRLLLLMPDHLHGIFSFGPNVSMKRVISDWKRYLSRHHNIVWQRDFFDHRLRNQKEFAEKWAYIMENPVRRGLCTKSSDWRYCWTSETIFK